MVTGIDVVCLLLNHLASAALGWKSPAGQQPDISKFVHFSFYELVYYKSQTNTFPSGSNEEQGCWVGIATHVGDALTYKVLTKQNKVIYHLAILLLLLLQSVTSAFLHLEGRQHLPILVAPCTFISSLHQIWMGIQLSKSAWLPPTQGFDRAYFPKSTEEDGQRFRARVEHAGIDKEDQLKKGS
jgi:hypothetical protein